MSNAERVQDLLAAVCELPPPQRAVYLDAACGSDAALRGEVESLLRSLDEAGRFLSAPTGIMDTSEVSSSAPGSTAVGTAAGTPHEHEGQMVGRYKLLQPLGEGGFGSVWMAEQREPVTRRVALKIIKLGMDTRQVIARFEAERQALALMDHPNIAKVLDAGATETGRPYFVMELVAGDPIVEYCDRNNLNITERLELFGQVCAAVQHAHSKGVIHRDIKPTNILVCTQDGRPSAKVIDFGIAKATSSRLTEKTLFTEHRQLIGTPEYMSPEQAEGNLDIDTRTDVYALGVLLYELLTGSTPFSGSQLRSAAFGEIVRIIREVDPPKPSTRLSQDTATIATVAARRRTEPRKLTTVIRGELDWIVMKCLEKDRSRRYQTANGLAMDIHRYLADEAVSAVPPSSAYRLRKFVSRHPLQLALAGTIALLVLGGAAVGVWMSEQASARRESELQRQLEDGQRKAAESARLGRNAEAVAVLLDQCEEAARLGDTDRATLALDAARRRFAEGGADDQADRLDRLAADLSLLEELDAIDQLRWTWSENRFADPELVSARTREAIDRFGADPDLVPVSDVVARVNASVVRDRIVMALDRQLQHERSTAIREVLRGVDADPYRDAVRDALLANDRQALVALADEEDAMEQPAGFAAFQGESAQVGLERRRELLQAAVSRRPSDAGLLMVLASSYPTADREGVAERQRWFQAAIAADPDNVAALSDLGTTMTDANRSDVGIRYLTRAIALDPSAAVPQANLGNLLLNQGRLDEAIACFRKALASSPGLSDAHANLGIALINQGRLDEAVDCVIRSLALNPGLGYAHDALGTIRRRTGRLEEAVACYRKSIEVDPANALSYNNLADALREMGQRDEAIAIVRHALALQPNDVRTLMTLGTMLCDDQHDYDGALECFTKVVALEPANADARVNLGCALVGKGKDDEAIDSFRMALDLEPRHFWARLNFANVLVLDAAGEGEHGGPPDPSRQILLRQQALELMREAVAVLAEDLEAGHPGGPVTVAQAAGVWEHDPKFDSVREPAALATLPEDQRRAYSQLWADMASLRTRAEARVPAVAVEKPDAGLSFLEETLERQRARLGPEHPDTIPTLNSLGVAYWSAKRLDRSVPLFEEALERCTAEFGPEDPRTRQVAVNLGVNYRDAGRLADAVTLLEQVHQSVRGQPDLPTVTNALLVTYLQLEPAAAATHLEALVPTLRADLGADHPLTLVASNNLGYALARCSRFDEAEAILLETIEREARTLGEEDMMLLQTRTNLGELYQLRHEHAQAEAVLSKCLADRERKEPNSFRLASTQSMLGRVLAEQRRFPEAELLLVAGYQGLTDNADSTPAWGRYYRSDTMGWLADLYDDWDKPDEAAQWQRTLEDSRAVQAGTDPSGER